MMFSLYPKLYVVVFLRVLKLCCGFDILCVFGLGSFFFRILQLLAGFVSLFAELAIVVAFWAVFWRIIHGKPRNLPARTT